MALKLDTTARAGEAEIPVTSAYLQVRPLVMDKGTRNKTDDDGNVVLVDGEPVTEDYWYVVADLRWWTKEGGQRLRAEPEQVKLEVDPASITGDPIAALYARLKAEPGFETAVDA